MNVQPYPDQHIDELLKTHLGTFYRIRQAGIDEELFDVISHLPLRWACVRKQLRRRRLSPAYKALRWGLVKPDPLASNRASRSPQLRRLKPGLAWAAVHFDLDSRPADS